MRIDFECSGGFANLRLSYRADTNELPPELAEDILSLVESSGFFDIQAGEVASTSAGPPDVFSYRVSLSEGRKMQSLSCTDVTAPATLHPLLALLRKLALNQGRKDK
jgi:hypothetical protein